MRGFARFVAFVLLSISLTSALAFSFYLKGSSADGATDGELSEDGNVESDNTNDLPQSNGDESDKRGEDIYRYDTVVPDGAFAVIPKDMSYISLGGEYICNETQFSASSLPLASDEAERIVDTFSGGDIGSAPVVLILHTHTTEAYNEEGEYYKAPLTRFARGHNDRTNVVSIGSIVAEMLNQSGIPTLHAKIYHDDVSYNYSYSNAEKTIKSYLEKYPSIKYVLDIHRDALMQSDGSTLRPICEADGEVAAQIMFVVGTSERSGDDFDWQKNLAMAQALRHRLNGEYENLVRPTYLRSASYNQKYSDYALLIEIGAAGNTLAEAQHSAKIVAEAITNLIKGN